MRKRLVSVILSLAMLGTLTIGTSTIQGSADEVSDNYSEVVDINGNRYPVRTPGNGTPVVRPTFPTSGSSETTTGTTVATTPETTAATPETTPETSVTQTPETTTPATETVETPETAVTIKSTVEVESIKAKTTKKGKVKVSWKESSKDQSEKEKKAYKNAKKIEVQYSTDMKFKKDVKSKTIDKDKTKVTLKGAKKNTTYYVRMRYVDENGNVSKWSKPQEIHT